VAKGFVVRFVAVNVLVTQALITQLIVKQDITEWVYGLANGNLAVAELVQIVQ
jgi:hypothetical protein